MKLTCLTGDFAVARAAPLAAIPPDVMDGTDFWTVSRTEEELSVVARTETISGMERVEAGWRVFKLHGPFAFDETGIVAGLSRLLADAGIGIFVISTYDTDYILVKSGNASEAADLWRRTGHEVVIP